MPLSCIDNQPFAMARSIPAPYSAGDPRSSFKNGQLIFSMWIRPSLYRFDRTGDLDQLSGGRVWIGIGATFNKFCHTHSASSFAPVATIRSEPFGKGRCSALASSHGARIQTSCSSAVVRITGIAFGCTLPTSAFG